MGVHHRVPALLAGALVQDQATAALVTVIVVAALPFAQNMTSVFREQRILQHVFTPLNYLSALMDYARPYLRSSAMASVPFGEDARRASAWSERPSQSLTILVIGETARAANFSSTGMAATPIPC